ncbi:MAG: DUF4159 domain-containing protein, partial [Planctomycetota bacterium]
METTSVSPCLAGLLIAALALALNAAAQESNVPVVDDIDPGTKAPKEPAARRDREEPEVSTRQVENAIQQGIGFLKRQQSASGAWQYGGNYDQGSTALVLLSLVTAGVPKDDPAIVKAANYIASCPYGATYCVALAAMALAAVDPVKYKGKIQAAADWLASAQTSIDMWTYIKSGGSQGDASNTQIAVLGLWEAEKAGAKIPDKTWKRVENFYTNSQNGDGGWGYNTGGNGSSMSMTAAGVASLFIVQDRMYKPKTCGEFLADKRLAAGLAWIAQALANPGSAFAGRVGNCEYYAWYAVERVGILSRQMYFGDVDWYRLGCEGMLAAQGADGGWGHTGPAQDCVETAFVLLFLAKGKKPLLVTKLHWDGDWNNNLCDVECLVKHLSQELRTPYDWHAVRSSAPVKSLLYSPVLFISGHKAPALKAGEIETLRHFMEQGGLIFAEACCGSAEFDKGFRLLVARLCPGTALEPLAPEHPLYRIHYQLGAAAQFLEGANWGCKTALVYSPRGISCQWDGQCPGGSKSVSRELALRIGTNVVVFGMGEELPKDRLAALEGKDLRTVPQKPADEPVIRGALVWAQVQHKGDCNPDPNMWPKLLEWLRGKLNLTVNAAKKQIALTDPNLRNYPLLYMAGHDVFLLSAEERTALRTHLQNGGALLAESCCGRKDFDRAFREMLAQTFPESKLEPLPGDHPLFQSPYDVREVKYRAAVLKDTPGLCAPALEVLRLGGRIAVLYSQYGLCCPIDGHPCGGCKSYSSDDALKIVSNLVMHALCGTAEESSAAPTPE